METVVAPPADAELQLLTEWGSPGDRTRFGNAGAISVLAHLALIFMLLLLGGPSEPEHPPVVRRVTPLIEPPTELTQRAPNKKKLSKEFDSVAELEHSRIQLPQSTPSTTRRRAFRPDVPQPAPQKATSPLPEAPKFDPAPPKPDVPQFAQATPPQILPAEPPKIVLENADAPPPPVAPGQSKVAIPNASVDQAIREAVRSTPSGGLMVGDLDLGGPGGVGPGINMPPTPGVQASNLELLSDTKGVDFRPYLSQVLAAVRRNWQAVIPESARLGRRGRVSIQFSISRLGSVPKLVIITSSGADSLDRAAVAGISASNPFPPLPSEYKSDRIVLQFNFAYNMPKR